MDMTLCLNILVVICVFMKNGFCMPDLRVNDEGNVMKRIQNNKTTEESGDLKLSNTRFRGRRILSDDDLDSDGDSDAENLEDWDEMEGNVELDSDEPPKEFPISAFEDFNDEIVKLKKKKKKKKASAEMPVARMKNKKKHNGTCEKTTAAHSCNCCNSNKPGSGTTRMSKSDTTVMPRTTEGPKSPPNNRTKKCPHGTYYRKGCRVCYCLPKRTFCESKYTKEDCDYWARKIHCNASRLEYEYNRQCEGECECKECHENPLKTVTTCARLPCHNAVLEEYGVLKRNDKAKEVGDSGH